MKTTTLAVTGTRTYTLRGGPLRFDFIQRLSHPPDGITIEMRRKPRLRWWAELVAWHCWRRWRRTRITIGPASTSTPVGTI
jgi:hypothetical protein